MVEIGQVLKVCDPVLAAHHMARIGATDRIIRAGRIYTERLNAFLNQPHTPRFVQAWILAQILSCAMKAVKGGRIQQQDVSTKNVNARARNCLIQVGCADVGLRLLVRDIDAARAFPMRFVYG